MNDIKLVQGDFFEKVKEVPDNSVDMIWADIPYGTTQNKWDKVWDLEVMWTELKRIARDDKTIMVFTASEPFNVDLINSNRKAFKYSWIWEKSHVSGTLLAKKRCLKKHELVLVFYKKYGLYNPQMWKHPDSTQRPAVAVDVLSENYNLVSQKGYVRTVSPYERYPQSIQKFNTVNSCTAKKENRLKHPTEKPVDLIEYMIKTYTNEGGTVFDPCMGTGSSALAAYNTDRDYIGIEIEEKYYDCAKLRLDRLENEE